MARRPYVSPGHVIWAYDQTIEKLDREGLSAAAIRRWLREECSLHVGLEAVRAVLASLPTPPKL